MLELKHIGMNYQKDDIKGYVFKDINLKMDDGECITVVGGSGCGKTTLINIISGLIKPTSGEVVFDGKKVESSNSSISVVSQDYGLFPWKNVINNICLPLKLKKRKDKNEYVDDIIKLMELEKVKYSYPTQLSGGQKQRVAIARALLLFPKLILMDEPFSALDPLLRNKLCVDMRNYFKKNNIMSVIVTHNIKEAVYLGDKILIMTPGREEEFRMFGNSCAGLTGSSSFKQMQHNIQLAMIGD